MNYNIEQLNILVEKLQKDFECITALCIISFILSILILLCFVASVFYEIKIKE